MKLKAPVITIDGAGGTGKGVVGHLVAEHLSWHILDSGVLYRVLAFSAIKHKVAFDNETALQVLAEQLDVLFKANEARTGVDIFFEGQDVTHEIRTETMGNTASKVGAWPLVRTALLGRQRDFRQMPGLVTDGRDMGTVVFPDADLKVFLTATPEERARRRYSQLKEKGIDVNLSDLILELEERDKRDSSRAVAPLKPAPDALIINTDPLSIEQVVQCILDEFNKVFSAAPKSASGQ